MMSEATTSDPLAANGVVAASAASGAQEAVETKSSSTEGPDSPGHSTTSSPIPMMMPASPYHKGGARPEDDDDDDSSTTALLPRYHVRFTNDVTKSGDTVIYHVKVRKLAGGVEDSRVIKREYDDFEYLHHCLSTNHDVTGTIVPPLPPRPALDPSAAEAKAKKQLGSATKNIRPDDFESECYSLEKYLVDLLAHPVFGPSQTLDDFLGRDDAPTRGKIPGKGIFSSVRDSLDARRGSTRDVDDFFQKERDWAAEYGSHLRDVCDRFQNVLNSQLRLANQLSHLATALNASVGGNEGTNVFYNKLNSGFSGCLEDERKATERAVISEDKTMGSYLGVWSGYLDAENAMLLRRTCLMVEKEAAVKAMVKAKPAKMEAAKLIKEAREKDFEAVSKTATGEIRRFHHQRLKETKEALLTYTEAQIKNAQLACDEMRNSVLKMKEFPMPQSAVGGADDDDD